MEVPGKIKNNKINTIIKAGILLALAGLFIVSGRATADTLIKGYTSKTALAPGLVVALGGSSNEVKIAPASNPKAIYGVVIDPSDSPVTLSGSDQQTFVATNGKYPVLVTSQKGAIKAGDFLSLSTIDGIAGKASKDQSFILGRALEPFDGKDKVVSKVAGISVGRISVDISPKNNPLQTSSAAIPEPLKRVSESIAGNPVGTLKIYIAVAVLIAASAIAGILITVGVRSGIVSIGRNPLSRKSIMRGLTQSVIMAILIFIVGLIGVYLLLKL
jgi:hypothetical protein